MKRFRVIMTVCLALLAFAIAVPAIMDLFDTNSIEAISFATLAIFPVVGKLETSLQIKERRGDLYKEMQDMNDLAKTEKRDLTDDEQKQYDTYAEEFDNLGKRLKRVEDEERRAAEMAGANYRKRSESKEDKEIRSYSILKAIRAKAEGRALDGIEAEMHQEAEKEARESGQSISGIGIPNVYFEKRVQTATGQTSNALDQGGMMVPTTPQGLIMALRPQLVLAGLGAKTIGGMTGNISMVRGSSTTVAWETETGDANEGASTTSNVVLSPKRLAAIMPISKQLIMQTSGGVQQQLMDDLFAAIAQEVERVAIKGGGTSEPTGILATTGIGDVAGGATGAAPTWSHVSALEKAVELANAMKASVGYLTNPKVKHKLRNTALDSGSGLFVWRQGDKDLNGYPCGISTLVPSDLTKSSGSALSAIIFGDFSQLAIYNWGGLDVVVDPYTLAGNNQIKLTVNSFWDIFLRQPAAFAAMLDAVTT
jgi:HK97 family phage major capsid protein